MFDLLRMRPISDVEIEIKIVLAFPKWIVFRIYLGTTIFTNIISQVSSLHLQRKRWKKALRLAGLPMFGLMDFCNVFSVERSLEFRKPFVDTSKQFTLHV